MAILKPNLWTIDIDQDWIDVTSGLPSYRETWKATDSNGHPHAYQSGAGGPFPTLTYVIDAQHWCDGDEGYEPHDGHWQVDEAHWECATCGEVVEPGMDPPGTPKQIPGQRNATITARRRDGITITAWLTEAELDQIADRHTDADFMAQLIDAIPAERITSTQFSR